ncbi:MAG: alpha/beta hydrolase [Spirochaetia bacterium]
MKKKVLIWGLSSITIVLLILLCLSLFWVLDSYPALENDPPVPFASVEIREAGNHIAVLPQGEPYNTGIIFYPGGKIEPEAYIPFFGPIAQQGVAVYIVKMPLNLAFLGINRAEAVISNTPDIERWIISGHSLGGAMACEWAAGNREAITGLILLASYPAETTDLSDSGFQALSITAENDWILNYNTYVNSQILLPEETQFLSIQGGNHAGFGYYGPQSGDGPQDLGYIQQFLMSQNAILDFIRWTGP